MIRIAHISDIHLSKDYLQDISNFIVGPLCKDLDLYDSSRKIDILAFTGDLIDKGGISFGCDIKLAFNCFEKYVINPLADILNLTRDNIYISPGNHDLNFDGDEDFVENGLESKLVSTASVNDFIDMSNNGSTNGINRVVPYKIFERDFYSNINVKRSISNFQSTFQLDIRDNMVGITCFNSSWRCYRNKSDYGRLIIGERQATNAATILENCDIKIALMHHPLDCLVGFDKKAVSPFIERTYDLILCGHAHEGDSYKKENIYGNYYMSIAPPNWYYNIRGNGTPYVNGYTIIDFNKDSREVETINRKYCHLRQCYDCNTDLGITNGVKKYTLLGYEDAEPYYKEINIAEYINNIYKNEADEHLLSYNTDTRAPKDIKTIFVMPRVVKNIEYDVSKEKEEEVYTLEDICSTNENTILFGTKESGKSVLLYRMLFEFADNIKTYHKTPVMIKFNDIGNKKIETLISRFLGIGSKEVKDYIDTHKIALLIDDFNFNNSNKEILKHIDIFKNKYNVQIYGTYNQLLEGGIQIEVLEHLKNVASKFLTIRNYKTKEIKYLIEKWFVNNESMNKPEKLRNISNVLMGLNLPSTPLSISMFLWIIEQQENYKPVNNAAMLENFIERLFKKHSTKKVLSGGFDYWNQQRLLADIAHYMYENGSENYRIPSVDIAKFIYDYFKTKKFEFEAEKELTNILDRGILVKERDNGEVYIRFRFSCFFHYFLMKKMGYDTEFRNYVLSESKYLSFTNEIDYFTGLKRDQVDILKTVIKRMNDEFNKLNTFIGTLENTYDDRFDKSTCIVNQLGEGFVDLLQNNKPSENELDNINDSMLDSIKPEKGIEKKEESLSPIDRLASLWMLAAKVLKNTEEADEENLKDIAYKDILQCSMAFANLYKYSIDEYIKKYAPTDNNPLYDKLVLINDYIPFIHQVLLHLFMGTQKLNMVIRDKIILDRTTKNLSEFERYISIFMYSDMRGKDYDKYIKEYVKTIKKSYIVDMCLIKLATYYFVRSNKTTDPTYLNMISELIVHSKGKHLNEKGKIITRYKNIKNKTNKDQGELDFKG